MNSLWPTATLLTRETGIFFAQSGLASKANDLSGKVSWFMWDDWSLILLEECPGSRGMTSLYLIFLESVLAHVG